MSNQQPFYGILWGCTHVLCGFPTERLLVTSIKQGLTAENVVTNAKPIWNLECRLAMDASNCLVDECSNCKWRILEFHEGRAIGPHCYRPASEASSVGAHWHKGATFQSMTNWKQLICLSLMGALTSISRWKQQRGNRAYWHILVMHAG